MGGFAKGVRDADDLDPVSQATRDRFSTPQYLARRNGVVIRSMRSDAVDCG
jgi:hypothetical protein